MAVSTDEKHADGDSTSTTEHIEKHPAGASNTLTEDVEQKAQKNPPPPPYSAFSPARRRVILTTVTAAGFFGPVCGAVYLPSLLLFQDIFHASATVINATVAVYMVFFAIVPLFGAAASDYGGRKFVYVVALGIFIAANVLLAALPPNIGALFVLRICQALGACVVTSIGAGTIADIVEPAKRASALSIFLLGAQLGPILGPPIGGQFASHALWRWTFGFLALACVPVYLLTLFCLPETLRCLVGNGEVYASRKGWFIIPRLPQKQLVEPGKFPRPPKPTPKTLFRPLKFVPNLIVSVNGALLFAGLYAMYITFPHVWGTRFGFSNREVGYAYLSPGIALLLSSLATGRLSDRLYVRAKSQSGGDKELPEKRISIQIYGFVICAAGNLMWGWFSQYRIHPAGGLVAAALVSIGSTIVFVTSTSYQTECDPPKAALLVALASFMRNLAAAVAAAIIAKLTQSMGYGWCFTGLGILDVICIPGVLLIMYKGPHFRKAIEPK